MSKVVLTASDNSAYSDLKEHWYHFPKNLLAQIQEAIGDWILFYEPRRNNGPNSSGGAQSYVAMARVVCIRPDATMDRHYFADLSEYVEFDNPVPFRSNGHYFESSLRKADGSTNKGAFRRSARAIPDDDFHIICHLGFEVSPPSENAIEESDSAPGSITEDVDRVIQSSVVSRVVREAAFRSRVRLAYGNCCAITGLTLFNHLGNPEVEAAHIKPVLKNGPDSVKNGIALTATAHWLFDAGIISIGEDFQILIDDSHCNLDRLISIFPDSGRISIPANLRDRPHPSYLEWHRKNVFRPNQDDR